MKSGIKNVDADGNSGTISSQKAKERMDNYIAGVRRCACPEGEEEVQLEDMEEGEPGHQDEQNLNGQVLYEVSGGGPRAHGSFAIGNGAVRAAAREGSVQPPSHYLAQEVAHLRRENARLQQDNRDKDSALQPNKVTTELILGLYRDLGKEVPEGALRLLSVAQAIATGSSHVGSESTNGGIDADGHHGSKDQDSANRAAVVTSHQHSPNHAST